jgi:high-affinity nickel-transport protein
MHDGKRPLAVGLFFSLGHSTVVLLMTVVVVLAARPLSMLSAPLRTTGMLVGTCVSALFLFTIAAANAAVFISVYRSFKRLRGADRIAAADTEGMLPVGFIARLCRRLFGLIRHSWQMYPLGLLFGLGFDTASEISLLAMSAVEGSKGLPIVDVLVLPALFLAGMSLIDTVDGVVMLGAYGWAFVDPLRKLYYNMTMTLISVTVALLVGGAELFGLIAQRSNLSAPLGGTPQAITANVGASGYAIVLVFIVAWIASMAIHRLRGYGDANT